MEASQTIDSAPLPWRRGELLFLAILCVAIAVPRIIAASKTVAPARDAFKYFVAARTFDLHPFAQAVPMLEVHPLYPWTLSVAHRAYVAAIGVDGPESWWRAAQIWSIITSVLFMAVAYLAGRQLWNPSIAFFGCLAIGLTPRQVEYGSDVLCDSLMSLLWMASFALLVFAWRQRWDGNGSRKAFFAVAAAGALAGFAYWTHVGAILLPLAFAAALFVGRWFAAWRRPMRTCAAIAGSFGVAYLLVVGAYVVLSGSGSPRNIFVDTLGLSTDHYGPRVRPLELIPPVVGAQHDVIAPIAPASAGQAATDASAPPDILGPPLEGQEGYRRKPIHESLALLLKEFSEETRVWLAPLALLGLFDPRRLRTRMPAGLLVFFAIVGAASMLVLLQIKGGYVAGRYAMPILPLAGMFAMTGVAALWRRIIELPRWPLEKSGVPAVLAVRRTTILASVAVILIGLVYVPGWLAPLHGSFHGYREAARWLRQNANSDAIVYDPFDCAAFFSERTQWRPNPQHLKDAQPPAVRYIVVDPVLIRRLDGVQQSLISRFVQQSKIAVQLPKKKGKKSADSIYVLEIVQTAQPEVPGDSVR